MIDMERSEHAAELFCQKENRNRKRLLANLQSIVDRLQTIGENDMGLLDYELAEKFHNEVDSLTAIADEVRNLIKD
jgi:hypothetical protein